jgi:hypothetical protein
MLVLFYMEILVYHIKILGLILWINILTKLISLFQLIKDIFKIIK